MRSRPGLALAFLLVACPSMSTVQTADTLAPGRWQIGTTVGVAGFHDTEQKTRIPAPQLELLARRGLASNVDAGLKLYLYAGEASVKWRCFRGNEWSFALAPSFTAIRTPELGVTTNALYLFGTLTGVASRPLSSRSTIAFGPKLTFGRFIPEGGGTSDGFLAGVHGSLHVRFLRWTLVPELGIYRTFAGEVPVKGGAVQVGLGFMRDL